MRPSSSSSICALSPALASTSTTCTSRVLGLDSRLSMARSLRVSAAPERALKRGLPAASACPVSNKPARPATTGSALFIGLDSLTVICESIAAGAGHPDRTVPGAGRRQAAAQQLGDLRHKYTPRYFEMR